jgi:hypothetical protein
MIWIQNSPEFSSLLGLLGTPTLTTPPYLPCRTYILLIPGHCPREAQSGSLCWGLGIVRCPRWIQAVAPPWGGRYHSG